MSLLLLGVGKITAGGATFARADRGQWSNGAASDWATSSSSQRITGTFTPSNSSLLVAIFVGAWDTSDPAGITTISGGGWTWTQRKEQVSSGLFSSWLLISIWTAPVTTGASMAITFGNLNPGGRTFYGATCHVFDYVGYNTGSPTGATAGDQNLGDAAANITLSGAPASTSEVLAASAFTTSDGSARGATEGSGWTEIYDQGAAGVNAAMQTQYRGSSTSTDVAFANMNTGAAASFGTMSIAAAIEIKAA